MDCVNQALLTSIISQSLFKFMSIESMMLSNHLILRHPLLLLPSIFPSIRVFSMSCLFPSGGQSIGASCEIDDIILGDKSIIVCISYLKFFPKLFS